MKNSDFLNVYDNTSLLKQNRLRRMMKQTAHDISVAKDEKQMKELLNELKDTVHEFLDLL